MQLHIMLDSRIYGAIYIIFSFARYFSASFNPTIYYRISMGQTEDITLKRVSPTHTWCPLFKRSI